MSVAVARCRTRTATSDASARAPRTWTAPGTGVALRRKLQLVVTVRRKWLAVVKAAALMSRANTSLARSLLCLMSPPSFFRRPSAVVAALAMALAVATMALG
jgi:hypothetical protein